MKIPCQICVLQIFSIVYLFILLTIPFSQQNIFLFYRIYNFLQIILIESYLKTLCRTTIDKYFLLCVLLQVLYFYILHLWVNICVQCKVQVEIQIFFLTCGYSFVPMAFVERAILFPLNYDCISVKNKFATFVWLFGLSNPFLWYICLTLLQ